MSTRQRIVLLPIALLLLFLAVGCSNSPALKVQNDATDLVILVHGLAKSGRAMGAFAEELRSAGYQICILDYRSIGVEKKALVNQVTLQINSCLAKSKKTPKVHFVGHPLGGLMISHYLQEHDALIDQKRLGRIVMIGTPNYGSEVADHYAEKF